MKLRDIFDKIKAAAKGFQQKEDDFMPNKPIILGKLYLKDENVRGSASFDALNIGVWQDQLICFILSLIYIFIGLMIQRKPFSIIGIFGVIEYIMYLEFEHIEHNTTLLTSVVLVTGLIILYAGVLYNKNVDKIRGFIESKLPEKIRQYLPQNRV